MHPIKGTVTEYPISEIIKCKYCGEQFTGPFWFLQHLRSKHPEKCDNIDKAILTHGIVSDK